MKAFILSKYIAFVPCPGVRGLWKRVPACVVMVACPSCESKKGVPCYDEKWHRYYSTACPARHKAAEGMKIEIHSIEMDLP
jgi:hypothetical protein